jgi:hypothetical protein
MYSSCIMTFVCQGPVMLTGGNGQISTLAGCNRDEGDTEIGVHVEREEDFESIQIVK